MNILIDVIIVAIALVCCISGYKNGFVKMIINFFKNIIALIVAAVFCSKLGAVLYNLCFKSIFEGMTIGRIASWLGVETSDNLDIGPLLLNEHSEFLSFVEKLGFSTNSITEKYNELGGESGDLMVEYIAKPLGMTVANVAAFILLFIASVLVIQLLGFILGKIVKLPVLNATNKILGLLLGIVLGGVFVFIFVALVEAVVPYIKLNGEYVSSSILEDGTILYSYLVGKTPQGFIDMLLARIGVK